MKFSLRCSPYSCFVWKTFLPKIFLIIIIVLVQFQKIFLVNFQDSKTYFSFSLSFVLFIHILHVFQGKFFIEKQERKRRKNFDMKFLWGKNVNRWLKIGKQIDKIETHFIILEKVFLVFLPWKYLHTSQFSNVFFSRILIKFSSILHSFECCVYLSVIELF